MDRRDFLQILPLGAIGFGPVDIKPDELAIEQNDNSRSFPSRISTIVNEQENKIYILSNFHPASCGWLDTFSQERNYCCNSYLNHLERVGVDKAYNFAISEVNNLIAIRNFRPEKFIELEARIDEGRIEAVNASFLECTINISRGEALVKQGVEGIRWQKEILNITPQFLWMIDVCGMHSQMAQITEGLGLKAIFYSRGNPTHSTIQWLISPDGSSTLGISAGHYSDWRPIYNSEHPLSQSKLDDFQHQVQCRTSQRIVYDNESRSYVSLKKEMAPNDTPYLVLGGGGDYSLAPKLKAYPSEFISQWKKQYPNQEVLFSTPSKFYEQLRPLLSDGKIDLPIVRDGWGFEFNAFWIENPKVKQRFRTSESILSSTEAWVTIASLMTDDEYPSQELYHAWLQLLLNMDRNTLWGAAAGQVFESCESWDANDRFNWIESHMSFILDQKVPVDKQDITFFNSCNWGRREPLVIKLPKGKTIEGIPCQRLDDDQILCVPEVPSFGELKRKIQPESPSKKNIQLPEVVETKFYSLRIDPYSGDLTSLIIKSSGKELLGGHANRVVAEMPNDIKGLFGDQMVSRNGRREVAYQNKVENITMETGSVATIIKIRSKFLNSQNLSRTIRVYNDIRRIDFQVTVSNVPDKIVVSVEFPFFTQINWLRRGIPYGFTEGKWGDFNPNFPSIVEGIIPVVCWSEYELGNDLTVALLDRGLTGREYDGKSALIFLMATLESYHGYPNSWLSGAGDHNFEYSIYIREDNESIGGTQKEALSYNRPFLSYWGERQSLFRSMLKTSSNLMVEAFRREKDFIEMRMVEIDGCCGPASLTMNLQHHNAFLTDLVGNKKEELKKVAGAYNFNVKPQQIVTIRFKLDNAIKKIVPLTEWDSLIPDKKLKALYEYDKELIGHPPFNDKL